MDGHLPSALGSWTLIDLSMIMLSVGFNQNCIWGRREAGRARGESRMWRSRQVSHFQEKANIRTEGLHGLQIYGTQPVLIWHNVVTGFKST